MFQGGDEPLQGLCGEFDSHRVHEVLLIPKVQVKAHATLVSHWVMNKAKSVNRIVCQCALSLIKFLSF